MIVCFRARRSGCPNERTAAFLVLFLWLAASAHATSERVESLCEYACATANALAVLQTIAYPPAQQNETLHRVAKAVSVGNLIDLFVSLSERSKSCRCSTKTDQQRVDPLHRVNWESLLSQTAQQLYLSGQFRQVITWFQQGRFKNHSWKTDPYFLMCVGNAMFSEDPSQSLQYLREASLHANGHESASLVFFARTLAYHDFAAGAAMLRSLGTILRHHGLRALAGMYLSHVIAENCDEREQCLHGASNALRSTVPFAASRNTGGAAVLSVGNRWKRTDQVKEQFPYVQQMAEEPFRDQGKDCTVVSMRGCGEHGFGSQIHILSWILHDAVSRNRTIKFAVEDTWQFGWKECGFSLRCAFEIPTTSWELGCSEKTTCGSIASYLVQNRARRWEFPSFDARDDQGGVLLWRSALVHALWRRIRPELLRNRHEHAHSRDSLVQQRCVAVHIRRGDHFSEAPFFNLQEYMRRVERFLQRDPEISFAIAASDDPNVLQEFQQRARIPVKIVGKKSAANTNVVGLLRRQSISARITTIDIISLVDALGSCRAFVAAFNTNIARLAYELAVARSALCSACTLPIAHAVDLPWHPDP